MSMNLWIIFFTNLTLDSIDQRWVTSGPPDVVPQPAPCSMVRNDGCCVQSTSGGPASFFSGLKLGYDSEGHFDIPVVLPINVNRT